MSDVMQLAPPPWRVSDQDAHRVDDANGQPVAWLAIRYYQDAGYLRAIANKLAAAPEMYAALKAITDCYGVGYKSTEAFVRDVHDFMMEGRAALTKARGESDVTR